MSNKKIECICNDAGSTECNGTDTICQEIQDKQLRDASNRSYLHLNRLDPELIKKYRRRYELKDELSLIEKDLKLVHSGRINILRQVSGLKKYTADNRDYRITYSPPKEYHSWDVKADPESIRSLFEGAIKTEYGQDYIYKFNRVIDMFIKSLLTNKIGFEKYEVRRHKKPRDDLDNVNLDVNFVTEDDQ